MIKRKERKKNRGWNDSATCIEVSRVNSEWNQNRNSVRTESGINVRILHEKLCQLYLLSLRLRLFVFIRSNGFFLSLCVALESIYYILGYTVDEKKTNILKTRTIFIIKLVEKKSFCCAKTSAKCHA